MRSRWGRYGGIKWGRLCRGKGAGTPWLPWVTSHLAWAVIGAFLAWLWMAAVSKGKPWKMSLTARCKAPPAENPGLKWAAVAAAEEELVGGGDDLIGRSFRGSTLVQWGLTNESQGQGRWLLQPSHNGSWLGVGHGLEEVEKAGLSALVPSEGNVWQPGTHKWTAEELRAQGLVVWDYSRTTLKNIVFGIAATAAMWEERREVVRLWWRPGELRGYAWMDTPGRDDKTCGGLRGRRRHKCELVLAARRSWGRLMVLAGGSAEDKPPEYVWMNQTDPTLPEIRFSEDFSQYKYTHRTGHRSAIRIARVVVEMYRLVKDDVFWYVMGDDDTVFSPDNLATVLSKYDPREMHYIGAPSESHLQNVEFSHEMAFGGGGFAISLPLARALSDMQDDCLHRYPDLYGSDARVQACLAELGVQLTRERGFHQFDLRGNVAGALEGHPVVPFLSMHHLMSLNPIFAGKSRLGSLRHLTKAMTAHPLEFLQQSMCMSQEHQWSVSIAWGYSVRWYPSFIRAAELERPQRTFRAWNNRRDGVDFAMDTRNTPVTVCHMPSLFLIVASGVRHNGSSALLETVYRRTTSSWGGGQESDKLVGETGAWEQAASEMEVRRLALEQGSGGGVDVAGSTLDGEDTSRGGRRRRGRRRRSLIEEPVGGSRPPRGRRKLQGLCPAGMRRVPPRSVSVIRVLAPPLNEDWVWAPRRHCCKTVEFVDRRTVEIRLGACGDGEIIA